MLHTNHFPSRFSNLALPILLCSAILFFGATTMAEEPPAHSEKYPALAPGARSQDLRVTEIKSYKTVQEFHAPPTYTEWKERKEELRKRVLVSCGLWPMPEKGPLHYEIFDRIELDDYTVEKVLLRTFPGYYATGNLYRPRQNPGEERKKFPGVLCPHGHWGNGRLEDSETASVPRRAASFAKQGYVAFSYDMVGYMDNTKFMDHGAGGEREAIWGISPAGFQLWTSILAIDFLQSLDDVDAERIGCTGASGGGTQTFLLCAVEDRIDVAAPVNMISSTMQGGCKCENAPMLRLDTNNMEIGALMAPRPLIMIAATGDWTKLTPDVEYPAVRSVYEMYGVPQRVCTHQEDAGHNYNRASRQQVYNWFRKWFYPFRAAHHFVESADLVVPTSSELAIFPGREVPADTLAQKDLFASLREAFSAQLAMALQADRSDFEEGFGQAYRKTLAIEEPSSCEIQTDRVQSFLVENASPETGANSLEVFLLRNTKTGQEIPAHLWIPDNETVAAAGDSDRPPVLLVHPKGKAALLKEDGTPGEKLSSYLKQGKPVCAIDCMGTGEFVNDASSTSRGEKEGLFTTYNLTDTACRVQDVVLAETYLADRFEEGAEIVGLPGAGAWVLLAHGLADRSKSTVADLSGLVFENDRCFTADLYIPNLRRVGDFITSIVLGAERPVKVVGCEDEEMQARLASASEKALTWRK